MAVSSFDPQAAAALAAELPALESADASGLLLDLSQESAVLQEAGATVLAVRSLLA